MTDGEALEAAADDRNEKMARTALVVDTNRGAQELAKVFPLTATLIIMAGDLPMMMGQAVRPRITGFNEATPSGETVNVNKIVPQLTPIDGSLVARSGRLLAEDTPPGTYCYVRDIAGRVYVVPDAAHAHITVLGEGSPATGAGELTISQNHEVVILSARSGTFRFPDTTLSSVRTSIEAQGLRVAGDAKIPGH